MNQHAVNGILKGTQQSAQVTRGKELSILEGNLVLLQDHPEGCNKIQDHFMDQELCTQCGSYKAS